MKSKTKIIIVDHEVLFCEGLERLLKDSGLHVSFHENSEDNFFNKLDYRIGCCWTKNDNRKCILIVNPTSIDSDAEVFCDKVRANYPFCKIIFMVPEDLEHEKHYKYVSGVEAVISKNEHFKVLFHHIELLENVNSNNRNRSNVGRIKKNKQNEVQLKQFDGLSERELEVLKKISDGYSNKQIAYEFGITERTVKNHVTNILKKLKLKDRTQAAIYYLKKVTIQNSQNEQN